MTAKPRIDSARNVAIPNRNRKLGSSSFARGRTSANESPIPAIPAASTGGLVRSFMKRASRAGSCSTGTRRPSESAERVV